MRVKNFLVTTAMAAVGLACLYEFGLSDEAKDKLGSTMETVKESIARVSKIMQDIEGVTIKDESPLPNAQSTEAQWKAIGF